MPAPRTDTPVRTPLLSVVFGYGPVGLIVLLGALALAGVEGALPLVRLWSAAILIFLAGVSRGLSFLTEGGPRASQIGVMLWRFSCGLAALVLPGAWAFAVLIGGYLSVLAYDPHAARHGEAPRFFARLRPPQVLVALAGLALALAAALGLG